MWILWLAGIVSPSFGKYLEHLSLFKSRDHLSYMISVVILCEEQEPYR